MDKYFYKALKHCYSSSNFKTQKELAITADVALSSINEAFQEKKAGLKVQMKVASAFGYELLDFLSLGRSLMTDGGSMPGASEKQLYKLEYSPNIDFKNVETKKRYIEDISSKLPLLDDTGLVTIGVNVNTMLYMQEISRLSKK